MGWRYGWCWGGILSDTASPMRTSVSPGRFTARAMRAERPLPPAARVLGSPNNRLGASGMTSVQGLNHMTLAVAEVDRAVAFYRGLLGFRLRALWSEGAHLEAGTLWLCLSHDPAAAEQIRGDYTHIAFDVAAEAFDELASRVARAAPIWRENRSEGKSLYVLDPDGHKIELHVGTLGSRLAA